MQPRLPSIRQKISLGFYAFAATMVLLAGLAYSDLRYLEWRINTGTAVADFLGAVLELRRYEKNYFLYGTRQDLDTAAGFLDESDRILQEQQPAFVALGGATTAQELQRLLGDYRLELERRRATGRSTGGQPALAQETVRDLGRGLADTAETLARAERTELGRAAQRVQGLLVTAVILVVVLGVLAARVLSRTAVRPMAWLEAKLAAIGEGRFNQVEPVSRDQEIVSMSRAVNRMLAEIESRNRQLVQSEKLASLGTLVAGVAHELNNPLSNISSSCQILIEEVRRGGGADPLEWLQQIDNETERARRIVQTLLEFSRERAFETQPVALRALVEQTLLLLGQRKGTRVEVDVSAELVAYADPQHLQQVLVNLIKNAEDAGGPDVCIRVAARVLAGADFKLPEGAMSGRQACPVGEAGQALVIEITDNGPGIPPEILPRVFDPFFTTKEVGHGSGLGLFVVQEIVDRHNGCIGVQSPPGGGTRFIVCLPHSAPKHQA